MIAVQRIQFDLPLGSYVEGNPIGIAGRRGC